MAEPREALTYTEATRRLRAKGGRVHTLLPAGGFIVGATWTMGAVRVHLKAHGAEVAGPNMRRGGYAVFSGGYFFATRDRRHG